MIARWLSGAPVWRSALLLFGFVACIPLQAAWAADCPGHPDALGTSRTLVVDPREHPRIGTMQYPETLPLRDHEVVLTFDDGPLPRNSNQVLQILAAQCVKATFFIIGRQAQANPEGVRKVRDAGHTVGTHSQNHPLTFNKMPVEAARKEIDEGIAATVAALGDGTQPAPFFRIPGLLRAEAVEEYLASKGIQTWSADFPADDWRRIPASRVYDLAIQRLEAKGKGILLLHDIQARTVAALPRILQELKTRGYRIVHVVPATPDRPATPTEPQQWQLHPASEAVAIAHWPRIPAFVFMHAEMLPGPSMMDTDWYDGQLISLEATLDRPRPRAGGVPLPRQPPWPRPPERAVDAATILPVPSPRVFELRDEPSLPRRAAGIAPDRVEQGPLAAAASAARPGMVEAANPVASRKPSPKQKHAGKARRAGATRVATRNRHEGQRPAQPRRAVPKHLVQVKKRNV